MLDYKILNNVNSVSDFQRAEEEFQMKKKLAQAELAKANQIDVDKLGERAFMKAAMGEQLSPEENAAAQFLDAKSGGIMFNPATGAIEQKPRISDKIGLGSIGARSLSQDNALMSKTTSNIPPSLPPAFDLPVSEFDMRFKEEMDRAAGNPKLQQSLREKYSKDKIDFDESQSKAAGFTNRVKSAERVFADKDVVKAALSPVERISGATPIIGNFLVSDKYQQFDQAQRDFVNAVLRRESGAVISDAEFNNARRQYLPQPGDSEAVLKQKKINRDNAISALQTSAGAAYGGNSSVNMINWEDLP